MRFFVNVTDELFNRLVHVTISLKCASVAAREAHEL
jgi:hypothetical protein